jgi:hypothetical protein
MNLKFTLTLFLIIGMAFNGFAINVSKTKKCHCQESGKMEQQSKKITQHTDEYIWAIGPDGCLHLARHEFMQIGSAVDGND